MNNAFFLNKKFFLLKKSNFSLCYFCEEEDETVFHLNIFIVQVLENSRINQNVILQKIWRFHRKNYRLLFFDFLKKDNIENETLYNRFFLIFKPYVYLSREKGFLSVKSLVDQIMKIKWKKIEKENSLYSEKSVLSIIKNRPEVCCLAFLSNTSDYWNRKQFGKKWEGGREGRREGGNYPLCLQCFSLLLLFLQQPQFI